MKIVKYVDESIKKGDKINIIDGSGLRAVNKKGDFYIICSYRAITGIKNKLKKIEGTVIATGIKGVRSKKLIGLDMQYELDVMIQLGDAMFFTCSQFLKKTEPKRKSIQELCDTLERVQAEIKSWEE